MPRSAARVYRPSQLRKMKGREQVAAVCFRLRPRGIEFLLVQTRNGRWTFPKGGTEPGLTHAQAAALEAFEEAGVHGRMEETAFASYMRGNHRDDVGHGEICRALAVHAHLCEVLRQERPQESGRKPTWLSVEKAKRRLQEARRGKQGAQLAGIVDRAVDRILKTRLSIGNGIHSNEFRSGLHPDPLRRVQFEAPAHVRMLEAAEFFRYSRRQLGRTANSASVEVALAGSVARHVMPVPKQLASRTARQLTDGKSTREQQSSEGGNLR